VAGEPDESAGLCIQLEQVGEKHSQLPALTRHSVDQAESISPGCSSDLVSLRH
jgi:hypothetical protein